MLIKTQLPVEFSSQGLRNGPTDGGFPDPRGAHEAQDGTFQGVLQLPNG